MESNSSVNAIACVRSGLGVAITEPVSAYGLPLSDICVRELDIDIPYHFGVVTQQTKTPRAVTLQLIEALKTTASQLLPSFTLHQPSHHHRLMMSLSDQADR